MSYCHRLHSTDGFLFCSVFCTCTYWKEFSRMYLYGSQSLPIPLDFCSIVQGASGIINREADYLWKLVETECCREGSTTLIKTLEFKIVLIYYIMLILDVMVNNIHLYVIRYQYSNFPSSFAASGKTFLYPPPAVKGYGCLSICFGFNSKGSGLIPSYQCVDTIWQQFRNQWKYIQEFLLIFSYIQDPSLNTE